MNIQKICNLNQFNNINQKSKNPNFRGILKKTSTWKDSRPNYGMKSGSGPDGYYGTTHDIVENYLYHPFANESTDKIQKVLKENNYSEISESFVEIGYAGGSFTQKTELGRTIPYTEEEWNRLPQREKDRITELL